MANSDPIGIFDSGVGGLTVLKALQARLPDESWLYLGDTARLPYGTKTGDTIVRYVIQAAELLVDRGIKMLVVACNTASAYALPALRQHFPNLPVIGVIEAGAAAASAASRSGRIAVLSTESTARANAYPLAIKARWPDAVVTPIACSLLVALAEEGWTEGDIALATIRRYLASTFAEPARSPDTLVLGCTHFPLLHEAIASVAGPHVTIIDSGVSTAAEVAKYLTKNGLVAAPDSSPTLQFLATDGAERFSRIAVQFLDRPITSQMIEIVDFASPTGRG